ncbi:cell division protein FtsB [Oryzisolibacter sp. LB2S]|uniref:cell division protein FtsB n=1 Tax=Alicycliphilus soli TaxID=3228789 RepID=UPI0034576D67
MVTRLIPLVLLALLVGIHVQLWSGRGSIGRVQELRQQIAAQHAENAQARLANEHLAAEVNDLKDGLEMVEEKARSELGMVRQGEIFVQVVRTPQR